MASFRAIEEGVNLVRHTSQGLAAAFDYQGRRLSAMDDYHAADYDMVSEIPTKVSAPSTRRWETGSRGCVRKPSSRGTELKTFPFYTWNIFPESDQTYLDAARRVEPSAGPKITRTESLSVMS
jgi:hypothetical protein